MTPGGIQNPAGGARLARVGLVGHCGPDDAMLSTAVRRALPGAEIVRIGTDAELSAAGDLDLLLVNRALDGEFGAADGVALIASLARDVRTRLMLISNYEDAQARAVAAGAAPGFGKSAVNTPAALEAIRAAAGPR